jgi:hypothetical protein
MCSWRSIAVARLPRTERSEGRGVFALVVRCRDMMLFVYCCVGKNRDKQMPFIVRVTGSFYFLSQIDAII